MAAASEESQIGEKIPDLDNEDSRLVLPGEQALAKARSNPDEAFPISITYSFDDKDNPRNWPKWKKWYITIFVSMLNVITYVSLLQD